MMNTPYMPFYTKSATVCSISELGTVDSTVTRIVVANNCGNENTASALYFTRFTQLKEIMIGDDCFMFVNQLNLIGLSALKKVVIGENSFTKKKNGFGIELNRRFFLKNCPSVRELRIGRYSFSDYSSAVIENNDSLEVIEMGVLDQVSNTFYSTSLSLNSFHLVEVVYSRFAETHITCIWSFLLP